MSDKLQKSLRHCADLVTRAIRQVRGRSLDLRPSMLDDLGLIPAMEHHLERQIELGSCAIEFVAEPLPNRPPAGVEIACYRIMQEAVTNVLRHARATDILITLSNDGERLWLRIKDNGRGFDVAGARQQARMGGSFGLLGMQERAVLNGGDIEIISEPPEGCEIRAWFPLGEG
jgi:signal transduction histidine kinase